MSSISSGQRLEPGGGADGMRVDEDRHVAPSESRQHVTEAGSDASLSISATSSSSSSSSGGSLNLGITSEEFNEEISKQFESILEANHLAASTEADKGKEMSDDIVMGEKLAGGNSLRHRSKSLDYTGESRNGEDMAEPKIQYFCPPDQHYTSDSWLIMIFLMLPFTTVPHFVVMFCLGWAYTRWHWMALLCYTTICAISLASPPFYSRRLRALLSKYLYGVLARYLPKAQYIVPEKPFPEDRPYIFAGHPHGRMFYSTLVFCQRHTIWRKNLLPKGDLFMTAAGGFFYVPFLRNLFYYVGVIPVSKRNIVGKLRKNDHVTILVGGVKEVLLGTAEDVDTLYLKKRKGFCKLAMKENAGLVPVYFFNENQLFRHNSRDFLKFWEGVNRHVSIGVPFMRGRYFILPMPFRKPILVAVGDPLFAEEGESLDAFHERYVEALKNLFEKFVAYSPDPKHKLVIT